MSVLLLRLVGVWSLFRLPVRDERGLSQSTENAILLAGAVTVAGIVIAVITVYVKTHLPGVSVCADGRHRDERGLSSSVQYAVLTPLLLLVVIGIVSVGIWFHGRNVAAQAASLAADEMRGRDADLAVARAAAERVTAVGGLREVDVAIDRGPTRVTVVVSAAAPTFFDLGLPRIQQRAAAPVERVTRP